MRRIFGELRWPSVPVEIITIAGSILLAFAIDAWWEERQQGIDLDNAILGLSAELADTAVKFERVVTENQEVVTAAAEIIERLSSSDGAVEIEFATLAALLQSPTADPPTIAFDALFSSGQVDEVEDPELRRVLSNWPAELEDLVQDERTAQLFVNNQLMPYFAADPKLAAVVDFRLEERMAELRAESIVDGGHMPSDFPGARATVMIDPDPEFLGLVRMRMYLSQQVLLNYGYMEEEFDAVRSALDSAVG